MVTSLALHWPSLPAIHVPNPYQCRGGEVKNYRRLILSHNNTNRFVAVFFFGASGEQVCSCHRVFVAAYVRTCRPPYPIQRQLCCSTKLKRKAQAWLSRPETFALATHITHRELEWSPRGYRLIIGIRGACRPSTRISYLFVLFCEWLWFVVGLSTPILGLGVIYQWQAQRLCLVT